MSTNEGFKPENLKEFPALKNFIQAVKLIIDTLEMQFTIKDLMIKNRITYSQIKQDEINKKELNKLFRPV